MKKLLCVLGITLGSVQSNAQFVNSEYYLIDSLDLKTLPMSEVRLIDSCLRHFHNDFDPVSQMVHVNHIVELSWDKRVGPRYNKWLHDHAVALLEETTDENQRLILKRYLAESLGYTGFMFQKAGNLDSASEYYAANSSLMAEIRAEKMKLDSTTRESQEIAFKESDMEVPGESDEAETGGVNLLLVVSLIVAVLMLVLTMVRIRQLKKKSDTFDASIVR